MAKWSVIARRIRVPIGFAFTVLYLWLARPTVKSLLLGAALVLTGLAIRALASGHVEKNQRLATGGPYAYSRNPLYLGSLILAEGFVLAARSWWIAVGVIVIFLAVYLPVIGAEETFLRERFPEFEEYARQVPRLLPRWSAFHNSHGEFSWDLYWKHREYNAALGSVAMVAALAAKLFWIHN